MAERDWLIAVIKQESCIQTRSGKQRLTTASLFDKELISSGCETIKPADPSTYTRLYCTASYSLKNRFYYCFQNIIPCRFHVHICSRVLLRLSLYNNKCVYIFFLLKVPSQCTCWLERNVFNLIDCFYKENQCHSTVNKEFMFQPSPLSCRSIGLFRHSIPSFSKSVYNRMEFCCSPFFLASFQNISSYGFGSGLVSTFSYRFVHRQL